MKLIFLSITICLLFIKCTNHEIEEKYYKTGELKSRVPLHEGKRHGAFFQYYKDGSKEITSNQEKGNLEGEKQTFYKNGELASQAFYKDGKQDSICLEFDSLGILIRKTDYKNDKPNGNCDSFYKNGQLEFDGYCNDGKVDGEFVHYYENGDIYRKGYYEEGILKYYKAYDEKGNFYDNQLWIEITSANKLAKYVLNQPYDFEIRLKYAENLSSGINVIIGPLDKNNDLIDTVDVTYSSSRFAKYTYTPTKIGVNTFSGVVYEMEPVIVEGIEYRRISGNDYFRFEIYVEGENL